MKTLLHICCAPCSVSCIKQLREEGIEPTGFWFNPNLHPVTEYRSRRDTLVNYAKEIGLELVVNDTYGLRDFVRAVADNILSRCNYCYAVRLEETAKYASENGFDSFTSTLFVSPYQDHELMKKVAEAAAKKYGVEFLYRDFRPHFREGQTEARNSGMYMQKYCGCIFSEEDRYLKTDRKEKQK